MPSPPKRRALRNPVGEGAGERYHTSASWSDEELQNLARAELRALKLYPGGHNINQLLRGVVPCRSFVAMKGTRRTTKYKAVRTLLALELDEMVPDGPVVDAKASVQPSSGDIHSNIDSDTRPVWPHNACSSGRRSECELSRQDRPLYIDNSGRRSDGDLSWLDRPLYKENSGRRSGDLSRHVRPLNTSSTGRQCLDLHE